MIVRPDTTITTVVAVPTSATIQENTQSTAERNSKLIGGLVGSIGGTILIGCVVVLFLFLKKRKRNNLTNQSPDFNDDSLDSTKLSQDNSNLKFGFGKFWKRLDNQNNNQDKQMEYVGNPAIFGNRNLNHFDSSGDLPVDPSVTGITGAGAATAAVAGSGINNGLSRGSGSKNSKSNTFDIERQLNANYGTIHDDDSNPDFVYRGVANSNNLDSVFRSSQNTSRGSSGGGVGSSAGLTPNRNSRINSFGNPLAYPDDFNFNEEPYHNDRNSPYPNDSEDSDDEHISIYNDLIEPNPRASNIFGDEEVSNNSRSRFTEEI